jgi:hypothetical protein
MADKYAARAYVEGIAGEGFLSTMYASAETPEGINYPALPREFVVKVNNGSGGVIIVSDKAGDGQLPANADRLGWERFFIHPDNVDSRRMSAVLSRWLSLDYFFSAGSRSVEWCYKGIKPRIIVEELLKDEEGTQPAEYFL